MARPPKLMNDPGLLQAALEGLQLQKQRIEEQIREVRSLLGRSSRPSRSESRTNGDDGAAPRKRELSEAARKRIAAAQKKRWAEFRKQNKAQAE